MCHIHCDYTTSCQLRKRLMPSSVLSLVFWLSLEFGSSPSLPALLLLCPLSLILNDKRSSMSEHKSKKPASTKDTVNSMTVKVSQLTPPCVYDRYGIQAAATESLAASLDTKDGSSNAVCSGHCVCSSWRLILIRERNGK